MRQLVDEARSREHLIDVGDRPEPTDAHVRFGRTVLGAIGRHVERKVGQAHPQLDVHRVALARGEGRGDWRKRRPREPRRRASAAVDNGLVGHGGHRVKKVELQVVLAAPHNLDWPSDFLREERRLGDEVRLRLAAEATAEKRHVADDVALVDAERRSHGLLCRLRILNGCPCRHLAVAEVRHRHRRFHRRVRVMRHVVGSLDDLATLGEHGVDVATAAGNLARLLHGCQQLFPVCRRVVRRVRAEVPLELQLLAPLKRRPRVVGDHGHAAERLEHDRRLPRIERDDLTDASSPREPLCRRPTSASRPAPAGARSTRATFRRLWRPSRRQPCRSRCRQDHRPGDPCRCSARRCAA